MCDDKLAVESLQSEIREHCDYIAQLSPCVKRLFCWFFWIPKERYIFFLQLCKLCHQQFQAVRKPHIRCEFGSVGKSQDFVVGQIARKTQRYFKRHTRIQSSGRFTSHSRISDKTCRFPRQNFELAARWTRGFDRSSGQSTGTHCASFSRNLWLRVRSDHHRA